MEPAGFFVEPVNCPVPYEPPWSDAAHAVWLCSVEPWTRGPIQAGGAPAPATGGPALLVLTLEFEWHAWRCCRLLLAPLTFW